FARIPIPRDNGDAPRTRERRRIQPRPQLIAIPVEPQIQISNNIDGRKVLCGRMRRVAWRTSRGAGNGWPICVTTAGTSLPTAGGDDRHGTRLPALTSSANGIRNLTDAASHIA